MNKTTNRRIYISGPISGRDIHEAQAHFMRAQEELQRAPHTVVHNPFLNGVKADAPYEEHMRADLRMLLQCDHIYMLKGWTESYGATLEFNIANTIGCTLLFEE